MKKYDFLFLDFMVQNSHKVYCNALISAINEVATSVVVEKKDYIYDKDESHSVFTIKTKEIDGNYPVIARYNTVYNFFQAIKAVEEYCFDKVVVLGYEPVMFYFMIDKLKKIGKVYLVQHHQLDEVSCSRIKRAIWDTYKNDVNHILLDDSIKYVAADCLSIDKKKIHTFPHPYMYVKEKKQNSDDDLIRVLSISQSNDVIQMKKLVEYEQETGFLRKNNIQIIIRHNDKVDTSNLKAFYEINGFLSIDEYIRLNNMADIVFMPFPLNYKIRCSGTLIDALSARKKVISSNIIESAAYAKMFPSICKIYDNVSQVGHQILALNMEKNKNDYNKFIKYQDEMKVIGVHEICN